jgi:hypothetical protein
MCVGKFLIGSVLCVGSISAASAMDADAQDLTTMQHSVDASNNGHDGSGGGSSGGDALGLSREGGSSPSGPNSSPSNDNCPSQTPPAAAPRSRRANIGWQSLLPGSIQ